MDDCSSARGITRTDGTEAEFWVNLGGANQAQNATITIAALDQLSADGFIPSVDDCLGGFAKIVWFCRFEVRQAANGRTILFDGAHNPDSIDKLVKSVERYFPGQRVAYVIGFSEDKDLEPMIERITRNATAIIATRSTHPRAARAELIAGMCREYGREAIVCGSAEHGLEDAVKVIHAMDSIDVFVITGSLFVAGGLRALMMKDLEKQDAAENVA